MTTTKREIAADVAAEHEISKAKAEAIVTTVFESIAEMLTREPDGVAIPLFGKFEVTTRAARKGKNPRTGELVDVPARRRVKFAASRSLTAAVQG